MDTTMNYHKNDKNALIDTAITNTLLWFCFFYEKTQNRQYLNASIHELEDDRPDNLILLYFKQFNKELNHTEKFLIRDFLYHYHTENTENIYSNLLDYLYFGY